MIKTIDALGNSTTNKYDADNKLIESTDANGNVTKYERDKMVISKLLFYRMERKKSLNTMI